MAARLLPSVLSQPSTALQSVPPIHRRRGRISIQNKAVQETPPGPVQLTSLPATGCDEEPGGRIQQEGVEEDVCNINQLL